jgi:hypothetical protein
MSFLAEHDDRVMADGRPAFSWWNEIQMLRKKDEDLKEAARHLKEAAAALGVAGWAITRDPNTLDLLIRVRRGVILETDPLHTLATNPEKYCTVEAPPL